MRTLIPGSISGTDSNQSMENASRDQDHPEPELHGLAHGLALLKKKRKKFSASRNTSPIVVPNSTISETISKKCMPPKTVSYLAHKYAPVSNLVLKQKNSSDTFRF